MIMEIYLFVLVIVTLFVIIDMYKPFNLNEKEIYED
jgi:hypothetical protein